ncbi:type VI secretion system baseplate subunit TssF [Ottowia pentelensis]|uniref:Type VI secretion system baseplate subunit TssF n=1 Tax=Ottowia pentelensis TaxID=511108 RepID=A0ABV6PN32_9BURK
MDPRLLGFYEQELRYFRESSGEFARAYPKIARRLGLDGPEVADPYVERLIEASAFLSARVLLKLDAEYPRFSAQLLDVVYPHFMAPTPSMLVAECQSELGDGALAAGPVLPRGSALRARRVLGQNTHCEFRTAQDLRLWPLELTEARYFSYAPDLPLASHPRARAVRGGLRLSLRTGGELPLDRLALDELVLYLGGGGDDVAWPLLECALADPLGALLCQADSPPARAIGVLDAEAITAVGFETDEALLPPASTSFSGYRLVQEYFAFAPRFQFVRVRGLQAALKQAAGQAFELVLLFSRARPELEKLVTAEHVRLHCVPAINLFPKRLDRVLVTEGVSQYHLLADRTRPQDFEVHSVTEVVGHLAAARTTDDRGEPGSSAERVQTFLPFYAAFHGSREAHPAYYTTTREPRQLSARQRSDGHRSSHIGSEVYMQIVDAQQAPYAGALRQLAVAALCTNRDLPLMLAAGNDTLDCADAVGVRQVRILRGPSRPFSPVVSDGLGWRVVDHLALNDLSLADSSPREGAAALREMLLLYAGQVDDARAGQIQGLLSVAARPVTRRLPLAGPIAFGRGLEVTLTIDPGAFHGHSAFLFGAVLAEYLARHVEVNHFVETVLQASGGSEIMRWRPRCGTRPIL